MKKFFFFAAAACVAFASCVKSEPSFTNESAEGAQVLFNAPVMSIATKGAEINGTVFPKDTNFVVFGYYQEGKTEYAPATGTIELYMDEVKCEYVAGDVDDITANGAGTWKHATDKYYWPKNGKLTFIAASPAEDDLAAACEYKVESTKSTLSIEYTAPEDSTLQADILYSDWKANCTASTHVSNEAYDGVELAFKHALSIVRINVRAKDDPSAAAVKVTGLSINDVYQKGKFTTNYAGTAAWDFTDVTQDYDYTIIAQVSDEVMEGKEPTAAQYEGSEAITTEFARFASYILLPQTFATDANITINYSIKHKVREGGVYVEKWLPQTHVFRLNSPAHKVAAVDGAQITEWLKGTRYTYDVTIGVDEIYFAPSVKAWDDVEVEYDNEAPQYKEDDNLYGNKNN